MNLDKCPFHASRSEVVNEPVLEMGAREFSACVFKPQGERMMALASATSASMSEHKKDYANDIQANLEKLISSPHYPCVAAVSSFKKQEYLVGVYEGFGRGSSAQQIRNDLLCYLEEQRKTQSVYLTYFAVFPESPARGEEQFEAELWEEISSLTSEKLRPVDWPQQATTDPQQTEFCFHLGGEAIFVVGLHANSSRLSRRLPYPTLIFNAFAQFELLEEKNQYDSMVKTNRKRDRQFQGSVNPMVELYGDQYEPIQFSGRNNSPEWRCPFHFKDEAQARVHEARTPTPSPSVVGDGRP